MLHRLSRPIAAAALGLAILSSGASGASERPASPLRQVAAQAYPGEAYAQYYGPRRVYGGRGYRGRGYRGRGYGAAVGAGIAGLAAGALIGGALAGTPSGPLPPGTPVGNVYGYDPNAVNYCAQRYRSYDPASGTFLGRDGFRYPCP